MAKKNETKGHLLKGPLASLASGKKGEKSLQSQENLGI